MSAITTDMLGKPLLIDISKRAQKQLDDRQAPLLIEMELYFSCLIRKQIRVREELNEAFSIKVSDDLHVGFRPVMTKSCSIASCDDGKPPLSDFPIKKPESYIPKWLKLDFKKGEWCGDFGY